MEVEIIKWIDDVSFRFLDRGGQTVTRLLSGSGVITVINQRWRRQVSQGHGVVSAILLVPVIKEPRRKGVHPCKWMRGEICVWRLGDETVGEWRLEMESGTLFSRAWGEWIDHGFLGRFCWILDSSWAVRWTRQLYGGCIDLGQGVPKGWKSDSKN